MKYLVSILFLLVSTSAWALPHPDQVLADDLKIILEDEMKASDGELLELSCGSYFDGILCDSKIRLFDTVPFGSINGGGEETCHELMEYRGGGQYNLLCSSCEYAKTYDLYNQNCIVKN